MGFFMILLLIGVFAVVGLSNAAKRGSNNSSSASQDGTESRTASQDALKTWTCPVCGTRSNTGKFCTCCGQSRPEAHPAADAARAFTEAPASRTAEAPARTAAPHVLTTTVSAKVAPSTGHVVEASSISGHAHTESSMTGFTECAPSAPAAKQAAAARAAAVSPAPASPAPSGSFTFDAAKMRDAIIYSEILGKPKALRH